jgi:F0F1-type ATP synthase membrane subunit c/vacuolar-type H+-ATPase subunit K
MRADYMRDEGRLTARSAPKHVDWGTPVLFAIAAGSSAAASAQAVAYQNQGLESRWLVAVILAAVFALVALVTGIWGLTELISRHHRPK